MAAAPAAPAVAAPAKPVKLTPEQAAAKHRAEVVAATGADWDDPPPVTVARTALATVLLGGAWHPLPLPPALTPKDTNRLSVLARAERVTANDVAVELNAAATVALAQYAAGYVARDTSEHPTATPTIAVVTGGIHDTPSASSTAAVVEGLPPPLIALIASYLPPPAPSTFSVTVQHRHRTVVYPSLFRYTTANTHELYALVREELGIESEHIRNLQLCVVPKVLRRPTDPKFPAPLLLRDAGVGPGTRIVTLFQLYG